MTDRGLPLVDGAPACPFVAFEDDRDGRATAPDHRHRCFAEPRPAPRALAHQEAYCLSSAFPVCPTFQDWARREAAATRPPASEPKPAPGSPPVSRPMPPRDRESRRAAETDTPPPLPPRRNPQRDWAAPPPWAMGDATEAGDDVAPPSFLAGREERRADEAWGAASRGLAGSAADRLAGAGSEADPAAAAPRASHPAAPDDDDLDDWDAGAPDEPEPPRRPERYAPPPREDRDDAPGRDDWPPAPSRQDRAAPPRRQDRDPRAARRPADRSAAGGRREHVRRTTEDEAAQLFGPAWERPRRYEAYPSLRTRIGLPGLPRLSGLAVGVVALLLAGIVLFFVGPMLLGTGGSRPGTGGGATPSPSVVVTPEPSPTATPAPTPFVYVVVQNDTMSKIAKKFGLTIDQILAVNPQIKNPDRIKVGDEITIPVAEPSAPDQVGGSAAP
jgi:hypothetical protein